MAVIHKIENIDFDKDEEFGAVLEVDSLRRDLARYDQMFQALSHEKNRLQDEMNRSTTFDRTQQADVSSLERENRMLSAKVRQLTEEIDQTKLGMSRVSNNSSNLYGTPFNKKQDQSSISLALLIDDLEKGDPHHIQSG